MWLALHLVDTGLGHSGRQKLLPDAVGVHLVYADDGFGTGCLASSRTSLNVQR